KDPFSRIPFKLTCKELYFVSEMSMSRSNQKDVEGILDSENSGFGDFDDQVSIDGSIFRRFGFNAQESSGNEVILYVYILPCY
ncbi:unnamed protein product, partial [Allacma fusca]